MRVELILERENIKFKKPYLIFTCDKLLREGSFPFSRKTSLANGEGDRNGGRRILEKAVGPARLSRNLLA